MIKFFNLTDDYATDLLKLIQVVQHLQIILLFLICYNILLYYVNETKLENILLKFLPIKWVSFYIKSLKLFKKTGLVIIIWLVLVLFFSTYISSHYLDFFIENFDPLCEFYLKNKNK